MNRIKSKYFILLFISWSTLACNNTSDPVKNKDPFYSEDSGYDYIRFPLIKPYEVISLDKKKSWNIKGGPKPKTFDDINDIFEIKNNIVEKTI